MIEVTKWIYKRRLLEFRDYLIYMACSGRIRNNKILYNEYVKLLNKYEEFFQTDEL